MGLPVGVALFGIGLGGAFVILASHLMEVPDFAPFVGLMIGLGVGIDYALLIVTRYREQLHAGHDVRESIGIAMDTAGRSVVFAGATVVISLLGMLLMGIGFVGGLGITASLTVAVTVVASITLLPALLGFAGDNIERTKWRGLVAAGFVAVALVGAGLEIPALILARRRPRRAHDRPRVLPRAAASARCSTGRPSRAARPSPTGGAGSSSTARGPSAIARPPCPARARHPGAQPAPRVLRREQLRRRHHDEAGLRPRRRGLRQGLDRARSTSSPRSTAPSRSARSPRSTRRSPPIPRSSRSSGPQPNDPAEPDRGALARHADGRPAGRVDDAARQPAARRRAARRSSRPSGADVLVSGLVAANVDMSAYMGERMPIFFGAVLTLSFLLLMVVFRSLLVPLKAVIMNLLSIGAAYGVIVALFQWGWLSDLTGVQPGPDRDVGADDAVRRRVRPLDGLRGVPALAGAGGVAPHRRQPHVGRRRPRRDGQGHHRRRRDHGRRLRQLHARVRAHA